MTIKQVYKNETAEDGVSLVQGIFHNDNLECYHAHVTANGEPFRGELTYSYDEAEKSLGELTQVAVMTMGAEKMSTKNDGGTAFPAEEEEHDGFHRTEGMSLRDYFAAKAMQSLLTGGQFGSIYELAEKAYIYADAMLVMREGA